MPNHHPSRSWRGCAKCKPHKHCGVGRAAKETLSPSERRLVRLGVPTRYDHGDILVKPTAVTA
jgi:hypothetical protein